MSSENLLESKERLLESKERWTAQIACRSEPGFTFFPDIAPQHENDCG
jgi:hypothetical protein